MAYTLFDTETLFALQKTLQTRTYERNQRGKRTDDILYGDIATVDPSTHETLIKVHDKIAAGTGADGVYGGVGDDWLRGEGGNDYLSGEDGDDLLLGEADADTLDGGSGDDYLDGGAGADRLTGGTGNDTYVVNDAGDVVVETKESTDDTESDTVMSSISFTLGSNVEDLVLTGKANIDATGNALDNVLYGNRGANVLTGGAGNDHYYIQNSDDLVVENSADPEAEWNVVFSAVSYTLAAASQIDEVVLIGKSSITLTGNEQDNLLEGNDGANKIYGGDGDDTLGGVPLDVTVAEDFSHWSFITAYISDDRGADRLYGGPGHDVMFLGKTDRAYENANEGIDTVVAGHNFTLGANIENLDFYGDLGTTEALVGTGNELDNVITSNLGADRLMGKTGNDSYVVYASSVIIIEREDEGTEIVYANVDFRLPKYVENLVMVAEDSDALIGFGNDDDNAIAGNEFDNVLDGQDGNDLISGGTGNDQLTGGAGNDVFFFNAALSATANVDTIYDFHTGEDDLALDDAVFTALAPGVVASTDFIKAAGGGAAPAQTVAGEHLLFDTDTGTLFYDADGGGGGLAVAVAVIKPTVDGYLIAASDFIVQ